MNDASETSSVLLVDDDLETLGILAIVLRVIGYVPETAVTVADAFVKATARQFGMVISDLRLPDGSGIDLLARLRQARIETPFVILTGYATISSAVEAVRQGACNYLEKPIGPEDLEYVIGSYCGQKANAESIDPRVTEVMRKIETAPSVRWHVNDLARDVEVSPSRLRHLFRQHAGHWIGQFRESKQLDTSR